MSGTVMLRRVACMSMFTAVFAVAVPFGLMTVVGCGSDTPEGAIVKPGAQVQQSTDSMKNFMESQKKGAAKK
jgi:hypothetical protein